MNTLTVAYTTVTFPPGTGAVAAINAILTGSANAQFPVSITPGADEVSVTVPADTYNYAIQNVDAQGNNLDGPFTGSFTIAAPAQVTLSLASGLSVAV